MSQMDKIGLLVNSLFIFDVFIFCCADSFGGQLKAVHHSSFHQVYRRSNVQRFRSNDNPLLNFDVRRNTIIRTQDSRAMGAEYLNEMKKPSNEACLMWCLEHPRCNAAVFEEKNNRSCYLFDCGSLSDFRCNFTSYASYISSILGGNQHSYDLKQWQSQSKHENELTSLRKSEQTEMEQKEQPTTVAPSRETSITEARASQQENADRQHTNWTPEPVCQHYQFQCRSNRECIAIYNVCDGIPQCPDASDEGRDLQCPQQEEPIKLTVASTLLPTPAPTTPTPATTEPPRPQPPEKTPYQPSRPEDIPVVDDGTGFSPQDKGESAWTQYQQQALAQPNEYPSRESNKQIHSGSLSQHSLFPNKHSSFHPASAASYRPSLYQNVNNNNQWSNDYYNSESYEPPKSSPPEAEYSGAGYEYRPHPASSNTFHMSPLQVGHRAPQPFDHYRPSNPYWATEDQPLGKGGYGKTEADIPVIPEMSHQQLNTHISRYSDPMMGPGSYPQQQLLPPPKSYSIPKKPQYRLESGQPYLSLRPPPGEASLKSRRPVIQPQVQNDGSQEDGIYDPQADVPRGGMVDNDLLQPREPRPPVQPAPMTEWTTVPPPTPTAPPTTTTTLKPTHKAASTHAMIHAVSHSHVSAVSAESGMSISELQQATRVHTHESNGAVLALTLGLSITAILMVLVACRLRNLRRKLARRGGRSSLAHDADYLVNGMYL